MEWNGRKDLETTTLVMMELRRSGWIRDSGCGVSAACLTNGTEPVLAASQIRLGCRLWKPELKLMKNFIREARNFFSANAMTRPQELYDDVAAHPTEETPLSGGIEEA